MSALVEEIAAGCVAVRRIDAAPFSDVEDRRTGERRPGEWRAALLAGPPGAGKSSLALALIARGGRLVSDERAALWRDGAGALRARSTERHRAAGLDGVVEARGVGLLRVPVVAEARVALLCRLTPAVGDQSEEKTDARLPRQGVVNLCGCNLPAIETRRSEALADALFCLLQSGELLDPEDAIARPSEGRRI